MEQQMTQQSTSIVEGTAKASPSAKSNAGDISTKKKAWWEYVTPYIPQRIKDMFLAFDRKVDGAASFFIKHYGKSRFMIAMSKKAQYLGIERLWNKGPKAFIYFFLFYLVRDTILYIIIPIYFAYLTTS